ncbi:MAG: hypothetical protein ACOC5T_05295 [Elusimicrobiota bacterium]
MNWFKIAQKRNVVTFDFDGTLTRQIPECDSTPYASASHYWVDTMEPNYKMMAKLVEEAQDNDIYIVTARRESYEKPKTSIMGFLHIHGLLPYVKDVIFAGDHSLSANKGIILRQLGSIRHYDDDADHIGEARFSGAEGIKIPEMDWDDYKDYEQNMQQYKEQYDQLREKDK